jgi:hypothetical protein
MYLLQVYIIFTCSYVVDMFVSEIIDSSINVLFYYYYKQVNFKTKQGRHYQGFNNLLLNYNKLQIIAFSNALKTKALSFFLNMLLMVWITIPVGSIPTNNYKKKRESKC